MLAVGAGAGWKGKTFAVDREGCYSAGLKSDSRASPQSQIGN